jgi:predicted peptidase
MNAIPRLLALAALTGLGAMSLMSQTPLTVQQRKSFEQQITASVSTDYLLFLPKGYGEDSAKRWPLMLFLHGAGERGDDLAKVAVHGPPKLVANQPDFPFILVSPQCPEGQTWDNTTLLALLDEVMADHAVDPARVYLTGLSMGGFGTWSLGIAHPERFAAIAPICGGGDVIKVLLADPAKAPALRSLPVWAFHGAKDPVVNLEESQRMINALKRVGCGEVRLTIYPEAQHDSWTETYNNPELYRWFLSHHRE